jgi:DDE family transposase
MGTSSHRNLLRTGHAKEKDIPMTLQREITHFAAQVKGKLTRVFDHDQLEALARRTGFVQRSTSKLTGTAFVELMTTDMLDEAAVSLDGLCDLLRQRHPQATMTPQALHQRILTPQASTYVYEVLQLALRENLAAVGAQLPATLLAPFGRVFLEDSTQCRLHAKLAEDFKGSGGSASTSTVKIDLIYDYTHAVIYELHITDGRAADQARAAALVPYLRAHDLVLRDLGYFGLPALRQIATQQACFLSRLCKGVQVYLAANDEAPSLPLVVHLQQHFPRHAVVDLDVYVGQADKLPCRLIAYRLPDEVVAHRRRTAHEVARKKGRTPTQEYLAWLQYGWYITNVSRDVWAAAVVGTVYRLRWQIELTFKHWKSLLHLHVLKGTRPERIKCLLYSRLITIVILNMISAYAAWYAGHCLQREMSIHKLINWLKRKSRLSMAIYQGNVDTLLSNLRSDMSTMLCKQKRKRKTSRQLLDDEVHYLEHFLKDEGTLFDKPA